MPNSFGVTACMITYDRCSGTQTLPDLTDAVRLSYNFTPHLNSAGELWKVRCSETYPLPTGTHRPAHPSFSVGRT